MDPRDRPDAKSLTKANTASKQEIADLQAVKHYLTAGALSHDELSEVIEGLIDRHLDPSKDFSYDFNSGWDRYKPSNSSFSDHQVDKLVRVSYFND